LKNCALSIYLARVTVELHIFSRMTFTENWFVYRDSFVGLLQIFKGNNFVMLEAAHELMRRVAIWAQEIGAIRATRHGALFGLAGGTQYCHVLDSGHIQYIGENIVARERRGTLRTNGSLLTNSILGQGVRLKEKLKYYF